MVPRNNAVVVEEFEACSKNIKFDNGLVDQIMSRFGMFLE
jgi:hypothetical protein